MHPSTLIQATARLAKPALRCIQTAYVWVANCCTSWQISIGFLAALCSPRQHEKLLIQ